MRYLLMLFLLLISACGTNAVAVSPTEPVQPTATLRQAQDTAVMPSPTPASTATPVPAVDTELFSRCVTVLIFIIAEHQHDIEPPPSYGEFGTGSAFLTDLHEYRQLRERFGSLVASGIVPTIEPAERASYYCEPFFDPELYTLLEEVDGLPN